MLDYFLVCFMTFIQVSNPFIETHVLNFVEGMVSHSAWVYTIIIGIMYQINLLLCMQFIFLSTFLEIRQSYILGISMPYGY